MKGSVYIGVLGVCACLAGCGKGGFSSQRGAEANVFRYPLNVNPTHLDPAVVHDVPGGDVVQKVFEGLVQFDDQDQLVANIASKWDISPDGTKYVFHLDPAVKFSNGRAVTADDFKFSFERACDPALKSVTAAQYLGDIVGANDEVAGKAHGIAGVKVLDPHTLELDIDKPRPYFLGKLAQPVAFVVCKEAVKPGQEILTTDQMIGTGPFIAKRYIEDQVFEYTSNPGYHGGKPSIDGIERPILKDAATRLNKYRAGDLDYLELDAPDVAAAKNDPNLKGQVRTFPRAEVTYMGFVPDAYPPFKDAKVRQAFCMAVNKQRIVSDVLAGTSQVAAGILPPGILGYRENPHGLAFEPEQAKQLLASAGYANGAALPPVEIFAKADDEPIKRIVEAIQNDLHTNLGVNVSVRFLDWTTFLSNEERRKMPLFIGDWVADYLDPQDFLSDLLTTDGPFNRTGYSNPVVDKLCGQADLMKEKDPTRLSDYAKAEDLVLQDAAWLPLTFSTVNVLVKPRVTGQHQTPFGNLLLTKVKLAK